MRGLFRRHRVQRGRLHDERTVRPRQLRRVLQRQHVRERSDDRALRLGWRHVCGVRGERAVRRRHLRADVWTGDLLGVLFERRLRGGDAGAGLRRCGGRVRGLWRGLVLLRWRLRCKLETRLVVDVGAA